MTSLRFAFLLGLTALSGTSFATGHAPAVKLEYEVGIRGDGFTRTSQSRTALVPSVSIERLKAARAGGAHSILDALKKDIALDTLLQHKSGPDRVTFAVKLAASGNDTVRELRTFLMEYGHSSH